MDESVRYIGIRLWDEQLINDVAFSLLFALLIMFAIVFSCNKKLFGKMFNEAFFNKKRENIFDDSKSSNEWIFKRFMSFQALTLSTICVYSFGKAYGFAGAITTENILFSLGMIFLMLTIFFFARQVVNFILGYVFAEEEQYRKWKNGSDSIMSFWGLSLYIPVIWVMFGDSNPNLPIFLFCILYIVSRILVIYKSIQIFNKRNNGFLYINLYLCALEILPLFVLYEGLVYLYNFIEKSSLWHWI